MDYKVLPMKSLPRTQALSSKTFRAPPLDGSLTIAELYDWHLVNNPAHPLFIYSDSSGQTRTLSWATVARAVHGAARRVRAMVNFGTDIMVPPESPSTVAILSSAGSIMYYTMMIGIMRAGHAVFLISPRNSPAATAHLLKSANVKQLIVGQEKSSQTLVEESLTLLPGDKPTLHRFPSFEELYTSESGENFVPLTFKKPDLNETSIIIHSSGSTAFPKPVKWNHYHALQIAIEPWFGVRDVTGYAISCHGIPAFHGMGMMIINWTCTSGLVLACFEPQSTAVVPSPSAVLKGAIDTKARMVYAPPAFVEIWSQDSESVRILRELDGLITGGGPLDQAVGDALSAKGVKLHSTYGCSECGLFSRVFQQDVVEGWDYFEVSDAVEAEYVPDGNGNFELVVKPGPFMLPCVFNTTVDGVPAYATGDLLTPHPTKPKIWKIFGRVDDQIMHSTGEKTNPVPLEKILNQDPDIQCAILFGRGKINAGVLIDPVPALNFDPVDTAALTKFRQRIWPSIEKVNEYAPQHSRIFKEMILVSTPSKPFTYTAKLTPRKRPIIEDYEDEINRLYEIVDESTQPDFLPPPQWDTFHSLQFVRAVVNSVLKTTPNDDEDIFQCGCDSLQATWIRNTIINALRKSSSLDARKIPNNFVYDNPSISALARYLSQSSFTPLVVPKHEMIARKIKDMERAVEKYSTNFSIHVPGTTKPSGTELVVLLTGTTGGLGSALLVKLVESPHVARVYAFNRKTDEDVSIRQKEALAIRGLDIDVLASAKLVLLEGDLVDAKLGLDEHQYNEIKSSVTHIIHNAYAVNFKLAMSTFEPNIAGLRRLIDLALSSPFSTPPRLLFTSSIGVILNYAVDGPVEEQLVDADAAVGSGYTESKWVCEQILASASEKTPLKPIVVRIGQMTGSSANGYWNPKEWAPRLFRSSANIGCFPNFRGIVPWLPVDAAAAAILEMCDAPNLVLHIAHPNPVAWSAIANPVSEVLRLPLVPYSQWLSKLESAEGQTYGGADKAEVNSALQLQDFFRSFASSAGVNGSDGAVEESSSRDAMMMKLLSTREAVKLSPSLKNCAPLDFDEAKKWLSSWGLI